MVSLTLNMSLPTHTLCVYEYTRQQSHIHVLYIHATALSWQQRQRPYLFLPPRLSLSLCIFLFIFIPLFEVVIALRVSFDALMNRPFSCDALENGNYDSLSLSSTFCAFLPPIALLICIPASLLFF